MSSMRSLTSRRLYYRTIFRLLTAIFLGVVFLLISTISNNKPFTPDFASSAEVDREKAFSRYYRRSTAFDRPRPSCSPEKPVLLFNQGFRLGNQMFAFASLLGISVEYQLKSKGVSTVSSDRGRLRTSTRNWTTSISRKQSSEDDQLQRYVYNVGAWCVCLPEQSLLRSTFEPLREWPACDQQRKPALLSIRNISERNGDGNLRVWYEKDVISQLSPTEDTIYGGYLQSWRYFSSIEPQLRRLFRFSLAVERCASEALAIAMKNLRFRYGYTNTENYAEVHIGVHVRRGDFIDGQLWNVGFTAVGAGYLAHAFDRMEQLLKERKVNNGSSGDVQLIFVVVSDDMSWCRRNIPVDRVHRGQVVFVSTGSPECDLAVLARCNHTIMSTGTYSWWAAWLANGETVYYSYYPRNGTQLAIGFKRRHYYRSNWIGLT